MAPRRRVAAHPLFESELKKVRKAASHAQREELDSSLVALIRAIQAEPHPVSSTLMQATFKAKSYRGVVKLHVGTLVEYSLPAPGRLSRVIAVFFSDDCGDDRAGLVLLVCVTITHDHDRMKDLIKKRRGDIDGWAEEPEDAPQEQATDEPPEP